jgi:hypothetical protein
VEDGLLGELEGGILTRDTKMSQVPKRSDIDTAILVTYLGAHGFTASSLSTLTPDQLEILATLVAFGIIPTISVGPQTVPRDEVLDNRQSPTTAWLINLLIGKGHTDSQLEGLDYAQLLALAESLGLLGAL